MNNKKEENRCEIMQVADAFRAKMRKDIGERCGQWSMKEPLILGVGWKDKRTERISVDWRPRKER